MLTGSRITGLDLTPGRVLAVELSRRGVERAVADERPDSDLGRLAGRLAYAGVSRSRVHVVAWDAAHIHRTMLLPRMSAGERTLFLERELARGEDGGARVCGARVVRQVSDGALTKDDVLIAASPREAVDRLVKPLVAARIRPRLVTTVPLALVRAAEALVPGSFARPSIIAYYGMPGLTLALVSDGILRLARQIPRLGVPDLDAMEWIVAEIQRSLRHHAQVSKGERVERVCLGVGDTDGAAVVPAGLEARLDLPVVDLNEALERRFLEGVTPRVVLPIGAFLPAFGAAMLGPSRTPNLLPRELVEADAVRRLHRGAVAAAAVVAVSVMAGAIVPAREAAGLRTQLERVRRAGNAVQAQADEAARIEAERRRVRQWLGLLSDDPVRMPAVAASLREVSRLAPDELRLERLSVNRDAQGYAMKLGGHVALADVAEGQEVFNRLYFDLRQSLLFHDVNFSLVKPVGVPAADAPRPFPVAFEVALRLKDVRR